MGRKFDIPDYYGSSLISMVKNARRKDDHYKKDPSPSILDLGQVRFKIARHFGFCFGVENAIEITYRAIKENPNKKVFLLSEMIHNPHVNADLMDKGVRFIQKTNGENLIPFDDLNPDDIVIIPAFGTTRELFEKLAEIGIDPKVYNATCPFVEKVWKRAESLGEKDYTVIIHGKHSHEETRATFSHSRAAAPSLIIRDIEEAQLLTAYIRKEKSIESFHEDFPNRTSPGFDPKKHLERIGVVNQTTMLATETQKISEFLKDTVAEYYATENIDDHFANTRDTLCYATAENQEAMESLIQSGGDLAIVVGGYNSSNTSHLVELCEGKLPAFYIKDHEEIIGAELIRHLNLSDKKVMETKNWLPKTSGPLNILVTAGASCPDALVDRVLTRIAEILGVEQKIPDALQPFLAMLEEE